MSLKENEAIVRRLFKAENEGNLASYDELMAPDYVDNAVQFTSLEEYQKNFFTPCRVTVTLLMRRPGLPQRGQPSIRTSLFPIAIVKLPPMATS